MRGPNANGFASQGKIGFSLRITIKWEHIWEKVPIGH